MSSGPGSYTYPYPAHYVTADIVSFTFRDGRLKVLLIKRGNEPFKGTWALPGGFLRPDEELDACARRELAEETALEQFFMEQFATIGTVGRDPRGRVLTVAYLALVRWTEGVKGGSDAAEAAWFEVDTLPPLAFDHLGVVKLARARLEQSLREQPLLLLKFLPPEYTTEQLKQLEQAVLAVTPERRSFYARPM